MRAITVTGIVSAPAPAVFAFMSDLRNHWQLTDRWLAMSGLTGPPGGPTGGWVELCGPLGVRRRLRTTVMHVDPPHYITGLAEVSAHTHARVTWSFEATGTAATRVHLSATIARCGRVDRLLLWLGGQRWLEHRFAATIDRLAQWALRPSGRAGAASSSRIANASGVKRANHQRHVDDLGTGLRGGAERARGRTGSRG
jgi:hypothetical protein